MSCPQQEHPVALLIKDLNSNRITRILTTDLPQYFALVSKIMQEVRSIGPEGEEVFDLTLGSDIKRYCCSQGA